MKTVALALSGIVLSGCINLTPDYVLPAGAQTSQIKVTTIYGYVNLHVVVHGADVCHAGQARLAATLTNIEAIGVRKKDAVFQVPADRPVTVSVPMKAGEGYIETGNPGGEYMVYTQPMVTFTPEAGKSYEIEFERMKGIAYELASADPGAARAGSVLSRIDESCRVTTTNHGSQKMPFYLEKR